MKERIIRNWYETIKKEVVEAGYNGEIEWQQKVSLAKINEDDFLRELAWVILCSGFRVDTVRKKWEEIHAAFYHFSQARLIYEFEERCRARALRAFKNHKKIDAIIAGAKIVAQKKWENVLKEIKDGGIDSLEQFPYIGKITKYHLAKNIGIDCCKPDRHLVRIAEIFNVESPDLLCQIVSSSTAERVSVADYVIWRWAAMTPDYVKIARYWSVTKIVK